MTAFRVVIGIAVGLTTPRTLKCVCVCVCVCVSLSHTNKNDFGRMKTKPAKFIDDLPFPDKTYTPDLPTSHHP